MSKSRPDTEITSLPDLKQQGFNAILVATGASDENGLDIEGSDLDGVMGCMEFLHELNIGKMPDVKGKTVMVIGGGNSAMDPARAAIRMGARQGHHQLPARPQGDAGARLGDRRGRRRGRRPHAHERADNGSSARTAN